MSLIQDALKRRQEEEENAVPPKEAESVKQPEPGSAPPPKTMPPKPELKIQPLAPAPDPVEASSDDELPPPVPLKSKMAWVVTAIIGSFFVMVIIVLVVGVSTALPQLEKKGVQSGESRPEANMATLMTLFSFLSSSKVSPVLTDDSTGTPVFPGVVTISVDPQEPVAKVLPKPVPVSKTGVTVEPQKIQSSAPIVSKVPVVSTAPAMVHVRREAHLKWPRLKLSGIMRGYGPKQGSARINGKMVYIDGQIQGVTLVEVKADGITLKFGKETRMLKVGSTLY